MDGVHDLGGMQGFGSVVAEAGEPVFHHRWERRVFGLNFARLPVNVDEFRYAVERMGASEYLRTSYYEHWLAAIEALTLEHGVVTREELDAWRARVATKGLDSVPRRDDPERAAALVEAVQQPHASPEDPGPTRYAPGERVRVSRLAPPGHTRKPRYARGALGTVERARGRFVLPDASAHGDRGRVEPLYSVVFTARELWGEGDHRVALDMWESYLEPGSVP